MFSPATALSLETSQRQLLESLARAGATPQAVARKCQVILLAAAGVPNNRIASETGLSRPTVIATRAAFARDGVEAIRRRQRRKRSRRVLTPELEQKIVDVTLQTRPADATHWSVRTLAKQLGVTRTLVHGVWQKYDIQPHRVERFKLSNDPKFEEKVRDVDVVFDTVGGDTQERAFQTLKRGGFLASTVSPPSAEKAKEFGVTVAMVVMMPKPDQLAEINRLLESGKLRVRVATVLPLAEVKKAHQLSAGGHADGKIILHP